MGSLVAAVGDERAPVASPKQLWLAHGAGHGEPFFTRRGEYEKQVVGFLDRHLLAA